MSEFLEHLSFRPDTVIAVGIQGHFEYCLALIATDQQCDSRRPLPEALDNNEPTLDPIIGFGVDRIDDHLVIRRGQLVLDVFEKGEKALHRVQAARHLRVRAVANHVLEALRSTVAHRRDREPLC